MRQTSSAGDICHRSDQSTPELTVIDGDLDEDILNDQSTGQPAVYREATGTSPEGGTATAAQELEGRLPCRGALEMCPPGGTAAEHKAASAFPTDARMRQKARAKAGIIPVPAKRKKKPVEDHFDDCGDDISGLGSSVLASTGTDVSELISDTESEISSDADSVKDLDEAMVNLCA